MTKLLKVLTALTLEELLKSFKISDGVRRKWLFPRIKKTSASSRWKTISDLGSVLN
jgi:hypothetical protein